MANFLKDFVKKEPHSLEFVRESMDLDYSDRTDYISLLKKHHTFLKESISVLMSADRTDNDKRHHLVRFFRLLNMHAKAEQETLYEHLKRSPFKPARLEGFCGQDEHDVVFQLEDELNELGYRNNWTEAVEAKAKTLASLLKNHIKEEESTMFAIAQRDLTSDELEEMRMAYLKKCEMYLDLAGVHVGKTSVVQAENSNLRN